MVAGLPVLVENVVELLPALPAVLLLEEQVAVRLEDELALVVIEDAIDVLLVAGQVEDQLILAGVLDRVGTRNRRRLVIGQRQRAVAGLGVGGVKAAAGELLLGDG